MYAFVFILFGAGGQNYVSVSGVAVSAPCLIDLKNHLSDFNAVNGIINAP